MADSTIPDTDDLQYLFFEQMPDGSDDEIDDSDDDEVELPDEEDDDSAEDDDDDSDDLDDDEEEDADDDEEDESPEVVTENAKEQKELERYAKKNDIDLDNLDRNQALKLVKRMRDSQRDFHNKRQSGKSELADEISSLNSKAKKADDDDGEVTTPTKYRDPLVNQMFIERFNEKNDVTPAQEEAMHQIVIQKAKTHGPDAALAIADDLGDLLILAKARLGDTDPDSYIEKGKKAERTRLAKRRNAAAPSGNASTSTRKARITASEIEAHGDDPAWFAKHEKEIDKLMISGELYRK